MYIKEEETTDIVGLLRDGATRWEFVPEQGRNFDNKTIPTQPDRLMVKGSTVIDGKYYNIVDWR